MYACINGGKIRRGSGCDKTEVMMRQRNMWYGLARQSWYRVDGEANKDYFYRKMILKGRSLFVLWTYLSKCFVCFFFFLPKVLNYGLMVKSKFLIHFPKKRCAFLKRLYGHWIHMTCDRRWVAISKMRGTWFVYRMLEFIS